MEDANSAQISTFAHGVRVPTSWKPPPGMAAAIWQLLTTQHTWVHRRVETVDVLSGEMVKRTMSIDFTIPPRLRRLLADPDSGGYFVPIALLAKEPRRNFSLRDESGRAIPVLGRDMNAKIAMGALKHGLERVGGQSLSPQGEDFVRRIIDLPGGDAEDVFSILVEVAPGELESIIDHAALAEWVVELADKYLLMAVIDGLARRRILKVTFEEMVPSSRGIQWRESLGLDPLTMLIPVFGPARSSSYHVELIVPEESKIELAALWDDATDEIHAAEQYVDRAALYLPWIDTGGEWVVAAALRMELVGLPTQTLVIGIITTCILFAGLGLGAFSAVETAPAVSLLLGASAVASGLTFAAGEHSLIRAKFFPVWLLQAVIFAAAVVAAAVVAFDVDGWLAFWSWTVASAASAAATGILALVAWRSRLPKWA